MLAGEMLSAHDAGMLSTLSDDMQSVMGSDVREAPVPSKSSKPSQPRWDGGMPAYDMSVICSTHLGLKIEKKQINRMRICLTPLTFDHN